MFEKSKVKSYNRLSKSKSGFKVVRVKDFLRKKDEKDNTVRNTVLGVAAISALGIGTTLLLKKKGGIKFPGQVNKTNPLAKQKEVERKVDDFINKELEKRQNNIPKSSPKPTKTKEEWIKDIENQKRADRGDITERPGNPITIIEERIGTPPKQKPVSGKDFIKQMDEEWGVGKKKIDSKEVGSVITPLSGKKNDMPELRDFWNTKNTPGTKMLENGDRLLKVSKRASGIRKKTGFSQITDPWSTSIKSPIKKSTEKIVQETENIKALAPAKFKPEVIANPWDTAIANKVSNSLDTVVKPNSKTIPLLTGKKIPASRGNIYGFDNRTTRRVSKKAASDAARIDIMEKTYKSISPDNLAMRATTKINHYLTRPRKTSNLGAPPKPTSLAKIIDTSSTKNLSIKAKPKAEEKIIKKAQEKVTDRLSRAEKYQLQKKASNAKKN